ncbi:Pol Polyprotein, partial [Phytophthora megakarya]
TSTEAAFMLDRYWLNRFPRPVRCIYDAGSEFKKEIFELLDSYEIEHAPTTMRSPQLNACAIAVQDTGTLTFGKGRYIEKVNLRRVRPCKSQRGGDCEDARKQ